MGLREKLNQNPVVTAVVAGVVLIAASIFILRQFRTESQGSGSDKLYFIDEDSTNVNDLFADTNTRVPPFEHNGRQAVIAFVYSCDDGKTLQIAYLLKYPEAMQKRLERGREAARQGGGERTMPPADPTANIQPLFKKPGGEWMSQTQAHEAGIQAMPCPSGKAKQMFPK